MRKLILSSALLLSLTVFACAPVATSVPKMARTSPRTGDAIVSDSGKYDLEAINAEVIGSDEVDAFKKNLDPDYQLQADEKDPKVGEIVSTRGAKEVDLSTTLDRADVMVVFVLNIPAKSIDESKLANLKIQGIRQNKGKFSFWVSGDSSNDAAWTYVKKNLATVSIAYREAKLKK